MLVKLLIAAVVVAPVVLLVVSALRGRARVTSCCSLPVDQDVRMRDAGVIPAAPPAPSAPSPSSAPSR
ncbi:MAG: hypothetical protein AB7O74_03660 [Candidatus Nanopelagicales bacterium]